MNSRRLRVLYVGLMLLSALLGFLKYLVFARLLSVPDFGIYSFCLVAQVLYVYAVGFGLNEAILKRGVMASAGETEAFFMRDLAASYAVKISLLIFPVLAGAIFFLAPAVRLAAALAASIGLASVTLLFNFADAAFRAQQKPLLYAYMLFGKSSLLLLLGIWVAPLYGVLGLMGAEVASCLVPVLLVFLFHRPRLRPRRLRPNLHHLKWAFGVGGFMMLALAMRQLMLTLERAAVGGGSGGTEALGEYSFAMIAFLGLTALVGIFTSVLAPRLMAQYFASKDAQALFAGMQRFVCQLFLLVAAVVPLIYLFSAPVIEMVAPQYSGAGMELLVILVFVGAAFHLALSFYDIFFLALSRERLVMLLAVAGLSLDALLLGLGHAMDFRVTAFASVFLAVRVFLFAISLRAVRSSIKSI